MKKLLILLTFTITTVLQAQAPQGFNYQATVRNNSGDLIINTNVYFKFNVIQGSETAVPIFTETHYVPTDDLGQVNLVIGEGTANTGVFSELDWSLGSYYLGIELDTGNGYVAMGTTQLLSVPYALYAENSGSGSTTLPDGQNIGDSIVWDGSQWVVASGNNNLNGIEISTGEVYQIFGYGAISSGVIGSDGGYSITNKGIVWSTSANPTVNLSTKTDEGAGAQNFSSIISNLSPITNYYYRAYASNSLGSFYGNTYNFTTSDVLPEVTTTPVSNISYTTANSGLSIINNGSPVTSSGIIWSVNPQQLSVGSNNVVFGEGVLSLTNLQAGTTYYFRSFAENNSGVAYGAILSFTTQSNIPSLETFPPSQITASTVYSGGASVQSDFINDGGSALTAKGLIWGTNSNLTIETAGNYVSYNCNSGSNCNNFGFWETVQGLQANTVYYIRAFAVNAIGTGYGEVMSFTTLEATATVPTVATGYHSDLTYNSAAIYQNSVINDGGSDILETGVIVSQWLDGLDLNSDCCENIITQNGANTGGFNAFPFDLQPGVTYYYTAYATNAIGTGYSEWNDGLQFTTPLNTGSVTDIDQNTYATIVLGTQEWMAENLKVSRFNNGTALTNSTSSNFWYQNYQQQNIYTEVDGLPTTSYFYSYPVVSGNYNICPQGWRITTIGDWDILISGLENPQTPVGNLKSNDSNWQINPSSGSPNGFNLNLYGAISSDGIWYDDGNSTRLWLNNNEVFFYRNEPNYSIQDPGSGACIRCIKE
jgi:uncharacterized protein (TIGR02145 family)